MIKRAIGRKYSTTFIILFSVCASVAASNWLIRSSEKVLNSKGKNVVKNSIAAEYQKYHLSRSDLTTKQKAQLLQAIQKMKIRSLNAKGENDNVVVRVEVEPSQFQPPGFSNVYYFQLKYSSLTGWNNLGRITAGDYYFSPLERIYN